MNPLRAQALSALQECDPQVKAQAVLNLWAESQAHPDSLVNEGHWAAPVDDVPASALPGRPARPALVPAKDVPTRSPFTLEGRAALLHAICHIEFNAINIV